LKRWQEARNIWQMASKNAEGIREIVTALSGN
jgi:hypothetical protein